MYICRLKVETTPLSNHCWYSAACRVLDLIDARPHPLMTTTPRRKCRHATATQ